MLVITRSALRWTGVTFVGVALLLGTSSVFLPWSQGDIEIFGDVRFEWGILGGAISDDGDPEEEWSWYDEHLGDDSERPLSDHDGVVLLRIAVPFYFIGMMTAAAGPLFILMRRRVPSGVVTIGGGSLWLVASILVAVGIGGFEAELFGGFADQAMETALGQILAFVAAPLAIVGGALVLVSTLALGAAPRATGTTPRGPDPTDPVHPPEDATKPRSKDFRLERRHRFR